MFILPKFGWLPAGVISKVNYCITMYLYLLENYDIVDKDIVRVINFDEIVNKAYS